jgi:uncharacterized protein (TIGR02421 family)
MTTLMQTGLADVAEIDSALTQIERELDLLLNITPVNAAEAWIDFERGGFSAPPVLQSRPLKFEPDLVLRRLYDLEIEKVDDPALLGLLTEKRDEIARQIALLKDRDTSRFLHGSLQLFGDVGEGLVRDARDLLETIPAEQVPDKRITASAFAEAAQAELDHYRANYEGFDHDLEIRNDVADLMVSHGRLLIPATANFRSGRVEALLHHEIGTHVLTFANGARQPLKMLTVGLPGYEETQEGLGVLAEYLVGGLDPQRLRLLAARVIAVDRMLDGAGFLELFEELHDSIGFPPKMAWGVTIRVARCGGLTKDVIYLRGITRVLEFVAQRKDLTPLLVGKLSLEHVPLIDELLERGVLEPPWLQPRWLEMPEAAERFQRVLDGAAVLDLIEKEPV